MYIEKKEGGKIAHLIEQTQDGNAVYAFDGQKTHHTMPAHEFFAAFREAAEDETKNAKGREASVS